MLMVSEDWEDKGACALTVRSTRPIRIARRMRRKVTVRWLCPTPYEAQLSEITTTSNLRQQHFVLIEVALTLQA